MGTIDTFGRRKWLLVTIPGMALALMSAALGMLRENDGERMAVVAVFMFGEWELLGILANEVI